MYLVRDGRDALVSLAHHRSDALHPGSDYYTNLYEAIIASRPEHYGGWSRHVRLWCEHARLVLRYEELIEKPLECMERMRTILDLPEPRIEKLPTFQDLQTKEYRYGSGVNRGLPPEVRRKVRRRFFRRGRVGAWRDEMPEELHQLFLELHGDVLKELGYFRDSDVGAHGMPSSILGLKRMALESGTAWRQEKDGQENDTAEQQPAEVPIPHALHVAALPRPTARVLIEASKLTTTPQMDGCKRYVLELLYGLLRTGKEVEFPFLFHVHLGENRIIRLDDERLMAILKNQLLELPGAPPANPVQIREPLHREMQKLVEKMLVDVLPARVSGSLMQFKRRILNIQYPVEELVETESPRGYDLIHLTLPNTYHHLMNYDERLITTVHDLSHVRCPHLQRKDNIVTLEQGLNYTLSRGSAFIAVSKATRDDLLTLYKVSPGDIFTVHEACDREHFTPVTDQVVLEQIRKKYGIPDAPYFLSLGTLEPRKNLFNIIKAFDALLRRNPELNMTLVVAGQKGWKVGSLFEDASLRSDRIVFTGFVDDEDLAGLYSGARAFCYVSHYEGFGLPALEAMNCGTPVIFGDNSSMPEVILHGGLPADSEDVQDIRKKMELLARDDELRDFLSWNALKRASLYSWERTVRKTLDVYRAVLGRG